MSKNSPGRWIRSGHSPRPIVKVMASSLTIFTFTSPQTFLLSVWQPLRPPLCMGGGEGDDSSSSLLMAMFMNIWRPFQLGIRQNRENSGLLWVAFILPECNIVVFLKGLYNHGIWECSSVNLLLWENVSISHTYGHSINHSCRSFYHLDLIILMWKINKEAAKYGLSWHDYPDDSSCCRWTPMSECTCVLAYQRASLWLRPANNEIKGMNIDPIQRGGAGGQVGHQLHHLPLHPLLWRKSSSNRLLWKHTWPFPVLAAAGYDSERVVIFILASLFTSFHDVLVERFNQHSVYTAVLSGYCVLAYFPDPARFHEKGQPSVSSTQTALHPQ